MYKKAWLGHLIELLLFVPYKLLIFRAVVSCRPFLRVVNIKGNVRRMIEWGQHMASDSLLSYLGQTAHINTHVCLCIHTNMHSIY